MNSFESKKEIEQKLKESRKDEKVIYTKNKIREK